MPADWIVRRDTQRFGIAAGDHAVPWARTPRPRAVRDVPEFLFARSDIETAPKKKRSPTAAVAGRGRAVKAIRCYQTMVDDAMKMGVEPVGL